MGRNTKTVHPIQNFRKNKKKSLAFYSELCYNNVNESSKLLWTFEKGGRFGPMSAPAVKGGYAS